MKNAFGLALIALMVLSGCESMQKPSYDLSVRNNSFTSDKLFGNIYAAVTRVDQSDHPAVTQRSLSKIEAIYRLTETAMGVERWTMQHDGKVLVPYLVKLLPDGKGYVNFIISPDDGSIPPRMNTLLPAQSRVENPDNFPKAK